MQNNLKHQSGMKVENGKKYKKRFYVQFCLKVGIQEQVVIEK